jgi:hypothetical protein
MPDKKAPLGHRVRVWIDKVLQHKEVPDKKAPPCPHCGQEMKKWKVPIASTWANEFFYVCFNDECPYFVQGWEHMWEQQATKASYRCRLDPDTGEYGPIPVWSYDALKDDIID